MTEKTKVVNYTKEQTEALVLAYTSADGDLARANVVAQFAEELGKKPASIRAKLSSVGVYCKPKPVTKSGEPVERKSAIVEDIAVLMGVNSESIESLEKATKEALKKIREALTPEPDEVSESGD